MLPRYNSTFGQTMLEFKGEKLLGQLFSVKVSCLNLKRSRWVSKKSIR